ncbi:MAG: DUF3226 domain-containing protein [Bacilli bacterium]
MKKLILCEGKTDAILLGYYLIQTTDWKYCRKLPKGFQMQVDNQKGETIQCYQQDSTYLFICSVGGKDKFGTFFNQKIAHALVDADEFESIAIMVDRDDLEEETIIQDFKSKLPLISHIENNKWIENSYQNSFDESKRLKFLLIIIPNEKCGALEHLLLEAMSENEQDACIIERNKRYIEEITPIAKQYLSKRRLKIKAVLGVTWAIQSPEKVFSVIDEQIRSVKWEESAVLKECFSQLIKI